MKLVLACVGRPRELAAAIGEYERRAARYWPLEVAVVKEESARASSPELVRVREGERLLARIGAAADVVACDAAGEEMTSEAFAAWLRDRRERGPRDLAFVIGGAYGLSAEVRARAGRQLALSRWTLPHEVARLVLAEQLYRAGTIVRGEPYHK